MVWICCILFIRSLVEGHWIVFTFWLLWICRCEHEYKVSYGHIFSSLRCIPRGEIAESYSNCAFNLKRNCQTIFHSHCTNFTLLSTAIEGSTFSTSILCFFKETLKSNDSVLKGNKCFPGGSDGKESACSVGDLGLIPGWGRSSGEGNGKPPQYSCLENPLDRGLQSMGSQNQNQLSD